MSSSNNNDMKQLIWGTILPIGLLLFLTWKLTNGGVGHDVRQDRFG